MSPRAERKALKQKALMLDQAVQRRIALQQELEAQSGAAEAGDGASLARMLVRNRDVQAATAVDMLHNVNKHAFGENLEASKFANEDAFEAVITAMAAHRRHVEVCRLRGVA